MSNLSNLEELIGKEVQIHHSQTTYLVLKTAGQLYRFDLIGKKEFFLKRGTVDLLALTQTHPLLLNYNEVSVETFINSRPNNFEGFVADFETSITEILKGCRNWESYILQKDTFLGNIKRGSGKLLQAPESVTQSVIAVCRKYDVRTKTFRSRHIPALNTLLSIGNNYVIAEAFRLRTHF